MSSHDDGKHAMAILISFAGLMGAAGVTLLAVAAHAAPDIGLDSAGQILLFHAAAVLGVTSLLQQRLLHRPLGFTAAAGLVLGAVLFSGDLTLRAFAGHRLFPMAAPTGGMIQIVSWLILAVAAIISVRRGAKNP